MYVIHSSPSTRGVVLSATWPHLDRSVVAVIGVDDVTGNLDGQAFTVAPGHVLHTADLNEVGLAALVQSF